MTSNRFLWVAILVLAGLTGCAMCDNSQDDTYPAFGGKWRRDNPVSGRVGSLFDPAGVRVTDRVVPTETGPTLAEAEAAETSEGAAPSESVKPSESVAPREGTEPKEAAEDARESVLDEPAQQDAPSMDEAETTQPEPAEGASPVEPAERAKSAKPAKPAKPAAERDALVPGLQLPALPFETPKTEAPKKDGTNLLPPLDLPSEP